MNPDEKKELSLAEPCKTAEISKSNRSVVVVVVVTNMMINRANQD